MKLSAHNKQFAVRAIRGMRCRDEIESGSVLDVEFLLRESKSPKQSERFWECDAKR